MEDLILALRRLKKKIQSDEDQEYEDDKIYYGEDYDEEVLLFEDIEDDEDDEDDDHQYMDLKNNEDGENQCDLVFNLDEHPEDFYPSEVEDEDSEEYDHYYYYINEDSTQF
jgi:hypothetical protein